MRIGDKSKYYNEVRTNSLVKNFSKLLGIRSNVLSHILYISSVAVAYMIALDARNSDTKLRDLRIEIPYFGCVEVEVTGNDLKVKDFLFEDEFKEDIINAVKTGNSRLNECIDKRLIEKLKDKYNEYV